MSDLNNLDVLNRLMMMQFLARARVQPMLQNREAELWGQPVQVFQDDLIPEEDARRNMGEPEWEDSENEAPPK